MHYKITEEMLIDALFFLSSIKERQTRKSLITNNVGNFIKFVQD